MRRPLDVEKLSEILPGRRFLAPRRRGKYLLLDTDPPGALLVHLGMSGRLMLVDPGVAHLPHTHVSLTLENGRELRFVDPRRFGRVFWEGGKKGKWVSLARLGPEPLEIPPSEFVARVRARRREIKPLLLDQHFLAGVGNIYADESLHRAGIHPRRKSDSLSGEALYRLHRAVQEVLKEAIGAGGSSVRSYVDSQGSAGGYQHSLRVYGREGDPCPACAARIVRKIVGGRSSFYCPRCQRKPPKRQNPVA